ncbi:MAG TPA: hypothetical protein ENN66_01725 [Proteobacteria bacterium]|nr:hypothetical protein [Pseudomonadota bacterium]
MFKSLKKTGWLVAVVLLAGAFYGAGSVLAYNYDFTGRVLYDSRKNSNSFAPGFNDSFQAVLTDGSLTFTSPTAGTEYGDFGSLVQGYFTQGGTDVFFAYSQVEAATSRMGLIWWSAPRNFSINNNFFTSVYGLAFYLEGPLQYTPAQLIAMRLQEYLASGYLAGIFDQNYNPHFTGCNLASGAAFLGLLESPFIPEPVAAVPLPGAIWLFGGGLSLLLGCRGRKSARKG